jgi:hypothetical protein
VDASIHLKILVGRLKIPSATQTMQSITRHWTQSRGQYLDGIDADVEAQLASLTCQISQGAGSDPNHKGLNRQKIVALG